MIKCPRCEQLVDGTSRVTCPICFAPLSPVAEHPVAPPLPAPFAPATTYAPPPGYGTGIASAPSIPSLPGNAPPLPPPSVAVPRVTLAGDIIPPASGLPPPAPSHFPGHSLPPPTIPPMPAHVGGAARPQVAYKPPHAQPVSIGAVAIVLLVAMRVGLLYTRMHHNDDNYNTPAPSQYPLGTERPPMRQHGGDQTGTFPYRSGPVYTSSRFPAGSPNGPQAGYSPTNGAPNGMTPGYAPSNPYAAPGSGIPMYRRGGSRSPYGPGGSGYNPSGNGPGFTPGGAVYGPGNPPYNPGVPNPNNDPPTEPQPNGTPAAPGDANGNNTGNGIGNGGSSDKPN